MRYRFTHCDESCHIDYELIIIIISDGHSLRELYVTE